MEDTVVVLAVDGAEVVERIVRDLYGVADDGCIHPEEGTDTVCEGTVHDLQGVEGTLPEIDEVAAGAHVGHRSPVDHDRGNGRGFLVLIEQAVLEVPDCYVEERDGTDPCFVHYVECIVN